MKPLAYYVPVMEAVGPVAELPGGNTLCWAYVSVAPALQLEIQKTPDGKMFFLMFEGIYSPLTPAPSLVLLWEINKATALMFERDPQSIAGHVVTIVKSLHSLLSFAGEGLGKVEAVYDQATAHAASLIESAKFLTTGAFMIERQLTSDEVRRAIPGIDMLPVLKGIAEGTKILHAAAAGLELIGGRSLEGIFIARTANRLLKEHALSIAADLEKGRVYVRPNQ